MLERIRIGLRSLSEGEQDSHKLAVSVETQVTVALMYGGSGSKRIASALQE